MSTFNEAQIDAMFDQKWICPQCGSDMEFEDENEDILVCPNCSYDVCVEKYGLSEEEYDKLYPSKEDVDWEPDDDADDDGESYDEVYDELSDD